MFHLFRVNAIIRLLSAKVSCVGGVFGCGVCLVWCGSCQAFASLHTFFPSLTGADRTDSSPVSKRSLQAGSVEAVWHNAHDVDGMRLSGCINLTPLQCPLNEADGTKGSLCGALPSTRTFGGTQLSMPTISLERFATLLGLGAMGVTFLALFMALLNPS